MGELERAGRRDRGKEASKQAKQPRVEMPFNGDGIVPGTRRTVRQSDRKTTSTPAHNSTGVRERRYTNRQTEGKHLPNQLTKQPGNHVTSTRKARTVVSCRVA